MKQITMMTAAVALSVAALAGCGGGSSSDGTLSELKEFSNKQQSCAEAVTGGEVMSADDLQGCRDSQVIVGYECPDGSKISFVAIQGEDWALVEGEAARPRPGDDTDKMNDYC